MGDPLRVKMPCTEKMFGDTIRTGQTKADKQLVFILCGLTNMLKMKKRTQLPPAWLTRALKFGIVKRKYCCSFLAGSKNDGSDYNC
jgi:hypothetical protein